MLRLAPTSPPPVTLGSLLRELLHTIHRLLIDTIRLGLSLGLLYLLAVALGVFR